MKKYDFIVIGAGSSLKILSALEKRKLKIALIEQGPLGGTCLNRGCIPSKMLIAVADFYRTLKEKEPDGCFDENKIDFFKIIETVRKKISSEEKKIVAYYKKNPNVDFYHGHARFISENEIEVNKKTISGKNFILNVGGRPRIPPILGLEKTPFLTSDNILNMKEKPKKIVIIGTGYIGVEYGFFFGALGSEVHLIGKSKVLENEDKDVASELKKGLKKYCSIHENCDILKISYEKPFFTVHFKKNAKKKTIKCDALCITAGREPETKNLGLENSFIKLTKNNLIKVDGHLRTTQKNVWALGDCISGYFFKHTANFEAEYLKKCFLKKERRKIKYPKVPYAIFSYPEIACVGKKEKDLKKGSFFIKKSSYAESARGIALNEHLGFVKLIFRKKDEKLIGAQIVGKDASVLIHILIALMSKNCKMKDLLKFLYVHPSLPEIIKNCIEDITK